VTDPSPSFYCVFPALVLVAVIAISAAWSYVRPLFEEEQEEERSYWTKFQGEVDDLSQRYAILVANWDELSDRLAKIRETLNKLYPEDQ